MSEQQQFIVLFQMIQVLTNMPSNAIPFDDIIIHFDLETCPFFSGNLYRSKALIAEQEFVQRSDKADLDLLREALSHAKSSLNAFERVAESCISNKKNPANYGLALAKFLLG